MRERSTSAMMETAPAISAALGCAPLIPPKPEEINKCPRKSWSCGMPSFNRPAFRRVLKVPCTMP